MGVITLKGAVYTRYDYPFRKSNGTLIDCWKQINLDLIRHLDIFNLTNSFDNRHNLYHFLCSTINGTSFSSGKISWFEVYEILKHNLPMYPNIYLDAYECASWGYALRYFFQRNTSDSAVLISIIDIDFFDFEFWKSSSHWGKSGFGLMTLYFENLNKHIGNEIIVGCSSSSNPITEFAFSVRDIMRKNETCVAALPFFPENPRNILDRVLTEGIRLPDLHNKWGHSFGNDPWISIIEHFDKNSLERNTNKFLACSLALNGYFAIAKIGVSEDAVFKYV